MRTRTYIGFDYGTKYIGMAVGGSHSGSAQPLGSTTVHQGIPAWAEIDRVIKEWQPDALVVGHPLNMDDSENSMTRAARKFGHRLQARYNLPIHWVDERLTSVEAKNNLAAQHIPWKQRRTRVDALAAQGILQAYLDECRNPKKEGRHGTDE